MSRIVGDVVAKILRSLQGQQRWELNQLASNVNDTATTITLAHTVSAGIAFGSRLSINGEDLLVTAVDTTTSEVTVVRGFGGSDAAEHANDDLVWINPRWSGADVVQAMEQEVMGWPPDLFQVVSDTIAVAASSATIELPDTFTGLYGIIDVRWNEAAADSTVWPRLECRLYRGDPLTWDEATMSGAFLRAHKGALPAGNVYVQARMPFNTDLLAWEADLVTTVGIPESAIDVLMLGTQLRLLLASEIGRSARDAQGEPRHGEEVPPAAALQAAQGIQQLYLRRRAEEMSRLTTLYPLVLA